MNISIHENKIYRILDEESHEFRTTPVQSLQRGAPDYSSGDRIKEPTRYTRVMDRPDKYLFYTLGTKFSERTYIQVGVRATEVEGQVAPLNVVMAGAAPVTLDSNLLYLEREEKSMVGPRRERVFIPLYRNPRDARAWRSYIDWAADPMNWTPQATALNFTKQVKTAGARITLSAQAGDSGLVLQSNYGGQVIRESGGTILLCKFVPTCVSGLMSATWYFGLREAIYFLTVVKKTLVAESAPKQSKDFKDIIKYEEPVIKLISMS